MNSIQKAMILGTAFLTFLFNIYGAIFLIDPYLIVGENLLGQAAMWSGSFGSVLFSGTWGFAFLFGAIE